MRRSARITVTVGLLVAVMVVGSLMIAFPTAGGNGAVVAQKVLPRPQSSGSSARTTVMEVFTGVWCPPCANADPALSRIVDEYSPDDLILIMYHVGSDPYTNTVSGTRDTYYKISFVPSAIVDGGGSYTDDTNWFIGAYTQKYTNYDTYRAMIDAEYGPGAPMSISLEPDLTATTARVTASIYQSDPTLITNLSVRFVLYEDAIYYAGSNGEPFHRAVARDMHERPLTISVGETVSVQETFALSSTWNRNKLGVAVMVQTNNRIAFTYVISGNTYTAYNGDILNAARADFVTPGISVYRDEPITDYTEPYERLLSQDRVTGSVSAYHFETYDILSPSDGGTTDVRGPPTATALAETPLLVWFTGSQGVGGTLDAAEQTLIQGYLSNTNGNLLIAGENLGPDIGGTAFYQNVLQANFVTDNSGASAAQGVAGDPISNTWATSSLSFAGFSPDAISARGTASVSFTYQGGGVGAGVRSDFDSDSRVLYLGFDYFAGSDPSRKDVMKSAIAWFDAKSAPAVGVGYPNGGETLLPGTPYKLTWTARDVEVPANGVDIYFTSDSNNPVWTLIASNEPNDGVYWWTPPAGVDSPLCRLKVVARDAAGNSGEDISDADFTIGSPVIVDFTVILQPGMNLVSFPVTPIGNTVASVLQSIDPWYRDVWTFDPATGAWKTWHRGYSENTLSLLDLKMGFWVQVTSSAPVTLTVRGVPPTTTSIALMPGWNLVGFPSSRTDITAASVMAATGATSIAGLGSSAPSYTRALGASETLLAGNGYWIYAPRAATWIVNYN